MRYGIPILLMLRTSLSAEVYWTYDAERDFTSSELYMKEDCGTCGNYKHFVPVDCTYREPDIFNPLFMMFRGVSPGYPALASIFTDESSTGIRLSDH